MVLLTSRAMLRKRDSIRREAARLRSGLAALSAGVALLLVLAMGGCGSSSTTEQADSSPASGEDQGTYVIGYSASLTGFLAPYDTETIKGVKLAIEQINEEDLAGGFEFELITKNNNSDAAQSQVAAKELVEEGVDCMFGPSDADPSIPAGLVAQEAGIPFFQFGSAPSFLLAVPSGFMTWNPDNVVGAACAEFALEQGWNSAFVLLSNDSAYTKLQPLYFADAFEQGGGTVLTEATYAIGQSDFNAVVTRIANSSPQPDVIFTSAYPPDSTTFLRQLRAKGIQTPFLSTDGNDTPTFMEAAGDAATETWYSVQGIVEPGDTTSPMAKFNIYYEQELGSAPESTYPALGYDTVMFMAEAVKKAGTSDPAAVMQAMVEEGVVFEGATGEISFTPDRHWPNKGVVIGKVTPDGLERAADIKPSYVPEAQ